MLDSVCVQKRLNIADLRLLSLKSPICKIDLWLESKNLNGKQSPPPQTDIKFSLINKCSSLCLSDIQTIWFILKTCFFSGSLEFWHILSRSLITWPVPNKNCGLLDSAKLTW